jgi:uncharacterized phiE125 gp8 family phage protein
MSTGKLRLITPPAIEPVSLSQALVHCHADAGVEDGWFVAAIRAGREFAENYQWRAFVAQEFEYTFDSLPSMPLSFPRAPLVSVDEIKLYDKSNVAYSMSIDDVFVDDASEPAKLILNDGVEWPDIELRSIACLKIKFTAGYGENEINVPSAVKSAILLYVAHMYENRSGEVPELPHAFYNLLRPNRLYQ